MATGITQRTINCGVCRVAEAAGVHHSLISKILRGKCNTTKRTAKRLKRAGVKLPATNGAIQTHN
jgi:plasmid maintenance system antidote protein VapI